MIKRVRSHHDFMLNYLYAFVLSLRRPAMIFIIFSVFSLIGLAAALIFHFESWENSKIANYFDALYFTVTIMTGVGLGDITPVTFYGRLTSMVVMLAGTSLFVGATAIIASSIISIEREHHKKEKKAKKKLEELSKMELPL